MVAVLGIPLWLGCAPAPGAIAPAAVGDGPARFEFRQTHMGSEFKLILYTTDGPAASRASEAVAARVEQLNRALSDYEPDSELNRLCDRAGGPPVPVGADLFRCLSAALDIARRSGGAFDPTIKPVVRLWRRAFRRRALPPPGDLERARALVGFEDVILDPKARTVQLLKPGMRLDLGGMAKGFAADEAQAVLRGLGIDRALVAVAGDIAVSGPPPGEPGWRIGIAPLDDPNAPPERFVVLRDAAISTSGDAERYAEIGGVRYSHIVNPKTGVGVVDRAAVTVVAPTGTLADSLETTVYILGPERGLELIEQTEGVAARFVRRAPGGVRTWESKRWVRLRVLGPGPDPPPEGR